MARITQTNIRLSEKERRALELLAAREERTLSEYLRELVRAELRRKGFTEIALTNLLGSSMVNGEVRDEQR